MAQDDKAEEAGTVDVDDIGDEPLNKDGGVDEPEEAPVDKPEELFCRYDDCEKRGPFKFLRTRNSHEKKSHGAVFDKPPSAARGEGHGGGGGPDEESIFRNHEGEVRDRRRRLEDMLSVAPDLNQKAKNYVLGMFDRDTSVQGDPNELTSILSELKKLSPQFIYRIVRSVFYDEEEEEDHGHRGVYGGWMPPPGGRGRRRGDRGYGPPPVWSGYHRDPYGDYGRYPPRDDDDDQPRRGSRSGYSKRDIQTAEELTRNEMDMKAMRKEIEDLKKTDAVDGRTVTRQRPVLGPDNKPVLDGEGAPLYEVERIPLDVYMGDRQNSPAQQISPQEVVKDTVAMLKDLGVLGNPNRGDTEATGALREELKELKKQGRDLEKALQTSQTESAVGKVRDEVTRELSDSKAALVRLETKLANFQDGGPREMSDEGKVAMKQMENESRVQSERLKELTGLLKTVIHLNQPIGQTGTDGVSEQEAAELNRS